MGGISGAHKGRSRGRRTGGRFRPMAEMNVLPMNDVMLVLLVVFMISAPLMTSGVPIDLPNSKAKVIRTEDNKPIELTLDKEGKVYLADTEVKKGGLVTILSATLEGDMERRIYVRADQAIEYGLVMDVLGQLNAAGFHKVALITKPKT
tara:strand:- start:25814 stop:26260 length:447 start_codon:yes stop_codon:yes gene_type:complete